MCRYISLVISSFQVHRQKFTRILISLNLVNVFVYEQINGQETRNDVKPYHLFCCVVASPL
jgi:hypothetical protein